MNIIFTLLCLFLSSCFTVTDYPIVQGLSIKKQKQKISLLQRKLESAEKEQKKVQNEVDKLTSEINQVHLALIRKKVADAERKKAYSLFLEERETLYQIIQTGPSPSAFEAQVELDRILRIITELSDERRHA